MRAKTAPKRRKSGKGQPRAREGQGEAPKATSGLFWVSGLHQGSGVWHQLFCYRSEAEARQVFRYIMSVDEASVPKVNSLDEYEDFRMEVG